MLPITAVPNGKDYYTKTETKCQHLFFDFFKKVLTNPLVFVIIPVAVADVAHLVERHLAKVEVASSSLVSRSTKNLLRKQ